MIYWMLAVTDESNEVSHHEEKLVPCPMWFDCPCPGVIQGKNKSVEEKIGG